MDKGFIEASAKSFMSGVDSGYQMSFAKEYAEIGDSALYGGKHSGSDAEIEGAKRIEKELKALGLKNVELLPVRSGKFQFNDATLTVEDNPEIIIKPYALTSPGTSPEGIKAELVDAGSAKREFFDNHDVDGKIVLLEGMGVLEGASLSAQIMQAEIRGAAAVIAFMTEDMLNEETIRVQPMNHAPNIPIVAICMKDAAYLKRLASGAVKPAVCLKVDAEFSIDGGRGYSVVGEIPGSLDERIIFSSHLDHYFRCMQDNISSVVTLLAIAKGMIKSGYRPNRTITFIFNSSHETGMMDSRYPYISGSYRVLDEAKPELAQNAVCDINFEYSALRLDTLTAFGAYELSRAFDEFTAYLPESMPGFRKGVAPANRGQYSLLSWADTISYITKGIPTIMNDSIHEQIYEGTSPYIGRDHSNHDNMDVFDEEALRSCTQCFGALGIYMDNMPAVPLEFTERWESVAFTEEEREILNSIGEDARAYDKAYERSAGKAARLSECIRRYNEENDMSGFNVNVNKATREVYRKTVESFDKISPQDFLTTQHSKHILDIGLLLQAKDELEKGNGEKALKEILPGIDIAAWSGFFDREIVDFGRDTICGENHADRRLWARGRELSCLTLFDEIKEIREKLSEGSSDFSQPAQALERTAEQERALLRESLKREAASMDEITEMMEKTIKLIETGEAND